MADGDPRQPMIDWVANVPPADLAAELLAAFGPGESRGNLDNLEAGELVDWLFRGFSGRGNSVRGQLLRPITEAMQLLEHAELVYVYRMGDYVSSSGNTRWTVTRLGWALLANGRDAVRQRIKDRTGL